MSQLKYPNIEAERARLGLTNDQLAAALGVTRKSVHKWMTNGNIPHERVTAMADLFGVSCDYLLSHTPIVPNL